MTARVSTFLKSRASPENFFQPLQQEETCNSAHEHTALSNDTIDFVLRQREAGRANELSAPTRISKYHAGRRVTILSPFLTVKPIKSFY